MPDRQRNDLAPGMTAQFDHERLDVYQVALEFVAWAADLIDELRGNRRAREVCYHLDRASLSILFNIAEGNGKRQRAVRAKFFDDSRGSATECAGCLDAMVARRCCADARVQHGKALLVRVVSMLSKLIDRFEQNASPVQPDDGDQAPGHPRSAVSRSASSSSSSSSSSSVVSRRQRAVGAAPQHQS